MAARLPIDRPGHEYTRNLRVFLGHLADEIRTPHFWHRDVGQDDINPWHIPNDFKGLTRSVRDQDIVSVVAQ